VLPSRLAGRDGEGRGRGSAKVLKLGSSKVLELGGGSAEVGRGKCWSWRVGEVLKFESSKVLKLGMGNRGKGQSLVVRGDRGAEACRAPGGGWDVDRLIESTYGEGGDLMTRATLE